MKNLAFFCFIFGFFGSHLIEGKSVNLKEILISNDAVVGASETEAQKRVSETNVPATNDKNDKTLGTEPDNANATKPNDPAPTDKDEKTSGTKTDDSTATKPNDPAPTDKDDKTPGTETDDAKTTEVSTSPTETETPTSFTSTITSVELSTLPGASKVTTPSSEKPTDKQAIEKPATDSPVTNSPATTKSPITEALVKHKYKMSGGATAGIIVAVLAVFVVLGGVYYHYSSKRLPKTKNASMSLKESRSKAFNKDS